jgi:hypothetical protein
MERSESKSKIERKSSIRRLYGLLAPRAYSILIFAALFCTLVVKFFHSWRCNLTNEYSSWILSDISVLLGIEVILSLICFRWPQRWVIRTAIVISAIVCTWSVMNAGWLIRTGTQILPTVLLPLFRDPLNALGMIVINLIRMPKAAVILLTPSVVAISFFFSVLAKPVYPVYNRRLFIGRIIISIVIVGFTAPTYGAVVERGSSEIASVGLRYNCQLRAVMSLVLSDFDYLSREDVTKAKRKIPLFDQLKLTKRAQQIYHNIVIVVLEGIQYNYTNLADEQIRDYFSIERQNKLQRSVFSGQAKTNSLSNLTPYLETLARHGVEFTNARSTLTHTTKALFALLTGRLPSVSQDIVEAVPAVKHYASLVTIVKEQLDFRTAFFQSAKGNFESRPGLVYNLGFEKFWARDDLNDPNCFLGYLGCDEFSMLQPIVDWIESDSRPFLLTVLCSVSHDPYEVPSWFAEPAKEPIECYQQTIAYTDNFLAALDVELTKLNLAGNTIFCVISDHGEAFGEHGLLGHERIAFDEVLRVPWVIRAPFLIEAGMKVKEPVSSIDLAPTLLGLLGFNTEAGNFDGVNALEKTPSERRVYFSSWMEQSPVGFVTGTRKYIYIPVDKTITVYDLSKDPVEQLGIELSEQQSQEIAQETIAWRRESIFQPEQQRTGKKTLFGRWLCSWTGRISSAKYQNSN